MNGAWGRSRRPATQLQDSVTCDAIASVTGPAPAPRVKSESANRPYISFIKRKDARGPHARAPPTHTHHVTQACGTPVVIKPEVPRGSYEDPVRLRTRGEKVIGTRVSPAFHTVLRGRSSCSAPHSISAVLNRGEGPEETAGGAGEERQRAETLSCRTERSCSAGKPAFLQPGLPLGWR
ncbi:hypothetical protein GN956_G8403 [Arapaima gigas]